MLRLRKRQSKPSLGGQTHYHTIGWLRGWVPLSLLLGIPVCELPFRNVHCRVISCESMSSRQSRSCVRRSLRRLPYLRKSHSSSGAEVQARNILIRSFSHIFEKRGSCNIQSVSAGPPANKIPFTTVAPDLTPSLRQDGATITAQTRSSRNSSKTHLSMLDRPSSGHRSTLSCRPIHEPGNPDTALGVQWERLGKGGPSHTRKAVWVIAHISTERGPNL